MPDKEQLHARLSVVTETVSLRLRGTPATIANYQFALQSVAIKFSLH
jgi:hypothetical protein